MDRHGSASPSILNVRFPQYSLERSPITVVNIFLKEQKKKHFNEIIKNFRNNGLNEILSRKPIREDKILTSSPKESENNKFLQYINRVDSKLNRNNSLETVKKKEANYKLLNRRRKLMEGGGYLGLFDSKQSEDNRLKVSEKVPNMLRYLSLKNMNRRSSEHPTSDSFDAKLKDYKKKLSKLRTKYKNELLTNIIKHKY